MAQRCSLKRMLSVAAACLLLATATAEYAGAQSARQRLQDVVERQRQVQNRLRGIKQGQAEAASDLAQARNSAQLARDRSNTALKRLNEVREILREVRQELAKTEAELEEHRGIMSRRLLAMYEIGQPSYLEVVLNATSFEDFTNRAEFSRLIARQDQSLLDTLVETEERLAEQRATLEVKHAQAEELKVEADRQKRIADQAQREAEALVAKYRRDRRAAEADYAALVETEKQIEAMLRSHARRGGGYTGTASTGRFLRPVQGRITSGYGWRIHPILRTRRFHNGVDIAAPTGTPIRAADAGRVIHSGWKGAYGKTIVIDHGGGWSTLYGHCSRLHVGRGQTVSRGQTIASVGSTGWSTGPHLHWTVYRNGSTVNPLR